MKGSGDVIRRWNEQGVLEEKASTLDWIRTYAQAQAAKATQDEDTDEKWRKGVATWEQALGRSGMRYLVAVGIGFVLATTCWGVNLVLRDEHLWHLAQHSNSPEIYK